MGSYGALLGMIMGFYEFQLDLYTIYYVVIQPADITNENGAVVGHIPGFKTGNLMGIQWEHYQTEPAIGLGLHLPQVCARAPGKARWPKASLPFGSSIRSVS